MKRPVRVTATAPKLPLLTLVRLTSSPRALQAGLAANFKLRESAHKPKEK